MKWTLLGFLGLGFAMMLANASGIRLLGQQPNGYSPYRPPLAGPVQPQPFPYPPANPSSYPYQPANPSNYAPGFIPNHVPNYVVPNQQQDEGRQALREAQFKLRAPDASESDKKEARAAIEKFLGDEFERDQKMRREQVERLEEQVSKLRKQLDKREQSKNKIIELRMQLMENEADGLSFPESFHELQRYDGAPGAYPPNYFPSGQMTNAATPSLPTRELNDLRNRMPNQPPIPPNMNRPPENNQGK